MRTILDASRADADALDLATEDVRVEDVVTTAVLDARELEGALITASAMANLPKVHVDPARVSQAITLVALAGARLGGKGVFLRAARKAGKGVTVDIEAPGNRLSPEERVALFAAFENAESARVLGSLGLGLTLARTLMRAHGGDLEIEAAEEGEGTLFRLRIPTPESLASRSERPTQR